MTLGISDEEIDLIAADGMRSAAGGIYETRVYEFAHAIEAAVLARWHTQDAGEPAATTPPREIGDVHYRGIASIPESQYLAVRLRRVCKLVGVPVPDGDNEFIASVAPTLLGSIALAVKQDKAARATQDSPQEALNARSPAAIDVLEKTP